MSATVSSKYMQKLYFARNMINQQLQDGELSRDQRIVDELCEIIQLGCSLEEFKKAA